MTEIIGQCGFEGYVSGVCPKCEYGIETDEAVFPIHETGIEEW